MIIDKIENAETYLNLHKDFSRAFKFLTNVKLDDFTEEKIIIDGDNLFAMLNDYTTKNSEEAELEAHREYIDIQYMLEGEELIGYSALTDQNPSIQYNENSDIMFFASDVSFYSKLTPGTFAVLYPQDLHMPGIKVNSPAPIKKIVVKIKI